MSSFSVLPFLSFAITVPLEVHTLALAECFEASPLYLIGGWRHIFSYDNTFSFQSAAATQDLVAFLSIEESDQNRPRVGAAGRT